VLHELDKPAQQTRVGNTRSPARVPETRVADARSPARVEATPLPGTRLTTNPVVNPEEFNNANGIKPAAVNQPSSRLPGSAWHETPPPPDVLSELHATWDTKFPDGASEVERRLDTAIGHDARLKYSGWKPYLTGWLQGDYDKLQTTSRRSGTNGNGHPPTPFNRSPLTDRFKAAEEESIRRSRPRAVEQETAHADAG
jgi:hypothetical protein